VGDIFNVRIAGNISSEKVLASLEYACASAGAKLVLVMGHTRCGAVTAAVKLARSKEPVAQVTGCQHIESILRDIQESIDPQALKRVDRLSDVGQELLIDEVGQANVLHTVDRIVQQSQTLANLEQSGRIAIVGAMYDVVSGEIIFLSDDTPKAAAAKFDRKV
jgi:carbonic anhydrase/SulP family sulfate permease